MKIKYLVYTILIVGLGVLIGYRIVSNKKATEGKGGGPVGAFGGGASAPTILNGIVVKPEDFATSISVTGTLEANEQVEIRSQYSGLVTDINFNEGTSVAKGQVLLQIDNLELKAQLNQAIAKEKLAAENEKRAKILFEQKGISQQEYDAAYADLRSLQAQTSLIRAQLAKTIIRAPFSGTIGLRRISVGEYITPQSAIANLVNINPVKLTFSVPEKYSTLVRINTPVEFAIQGMDQKFKAKVYAIEPSIETATRTLQLRAITENREGKILPGAFATVHLPIQNIKNAILIPTQAVVPVQKGKKVFVSQNGKAKEVMIETSTRTEKSLLITSGLKEGDTVITTGIMTLKADAPVKIVIGKN